MWKSVCIIYDFNWLLQTIVARKIIYDSARQPWTGGRIDYFALIVDSALITQGGYKIRGLCFLVLISTRIYFWLCLTALLFSDLRKKKTSLINPGHQWFPLIKCILALSKTKSSLKLPAPVKGWHNLFTFRDALCFHRQIINLAATTRDGSKHKLPEQLFFQILNIYRGCFCWVFKKETIPQFSLRE